MSDQTQPINPFDPSVPLEDATKQYSNNFHHMIATHMRGLQLVVGNVNINREFRVALIGELLNLVTMLERGIPSE